MNLRPYGTSVPRLAAIVAALAVGMSAAAQDLTADGFDLHGYGHVEALHRGGTDGGSEVEHDVSLLGHWRLNQRGSVWLQLAHLSETRRVRVDWGFLDWELTPTVTLRAGQVRLPLGLYNETRDVQALRPSASLPLLYDEDLRLADESLRGLSFEQRGDALSGEFSMEAYAALAMVPDADKAARSRVLGGRLTWNHPSTGVTLNLSGYAGRTSSSAETGDADGEPAHAGWQRKRGLVVSGRLDRGSWTFDAEAGLARLGDVRLSTAYGQASRRLSDQWAMFVRAERMQLRPEGAEALRLDRLSAGLAWSPSPRWGLRLEASRERGARLHEVEDATTEPVTGSQNVVRLSVNTSF